MELLIVMAIICILAGLAGTKMFNAMANARETGCRNNLRQLQAGALSYALDNSGGLPYALSYEWKDPSTGTYYERRGWVSWMPKNQKIDTLDETWTKEPKKSHSSDMNDDRGIGSGGKFGMLYGTLWDYVGNSECYVCPVQLRKWKDTDASFDEETKSDEDKILYRTYSMNPSFGSPRFRYYEPVRVTNIGVSWTVGGRVVDGSKTVLFYEFHATADNAAVKSRGQFSTYAKGMDNNEDLIGLAAMDPKEFDYKNLALGEIHNPPEKGAKSMAMVVYFDGHIEKIPTFIKDKGNTLWFLNRGLTPSDSDPTK